MYGTTLLSSGMATPMSEITSFKRLYSAGLKPNPFYTVQLLLPASSTDVCPRTCYFPLRCSKRYHQDDVQTPHRFSKHHLHSVYCPRKISIALTLNKSIFSWVCLSPTLPNRRVFHLSNHRLLRTSDYPRRNYVVSHTVPESKLNIVLRAFCLLYDVY